MTSGNKLINVMYVIRLIVSRTYECQFGLEFLVTLKDLKQFVSSFLPWKNSDLDTNVCAKLFVLS